MAHDPQVGPVLVTSTQQHSPVAPRDLQQCSDDAPLLVGGYPTGLWRCTEGTLHRPAPLLCPLSAGLELPDAGGDCRSDADCAADEACSCVVVTYPDQVPVPNAIQFGGRCQPASCRADAECGVGLLCVQVAQPATRGGCTGPTPAFACQTRQDDCAAAEDCGPNLLCLNASGRLDCLFASTTCE